MNAVNSKAVLEPLTEWPPRHGLRWPTSEKRAASQGAPHATEPEQIVG
jgi:hypothetical protein